MENGYVNADDVEEEFYFREGLLFEFATAVLVDLLSLQFSLPEVISRWSTPSSIRFGFCEEALQARGKRSEPW